MIEQAFGWVGQAVEWLAKFIPRWMIIDPTMGGVKYVHGKRIVKLEAGIHFWWPLVTPQPDVYPVVRQADNLRTQTLVTTDGKTVVVGGMIIYEVTDILKLLPRVFRAAGAVKDISLTCIHSVCCEYSYDELMRMSQRGTLDTRLKNETKKALEEYGVHVLKVQLTDLAPARVLKIMQSTSKDEE